MKIELWNTPDKITNSEYNPNLRITDTHKKQKKFCKNGASFFIKKIASGPMRGGGRNELGRLKHEVLVVVVSLVSFTDSHDGELRPGEDGHEAQDARGVLHEPRVVLVQEDLGEPRLRTRSLGQRHHLPEGQSLELLHQKVERGIMAKRSRSNRERRSRSEFHLTEDQVHLEVFTRTVLMAQMNTRGRGRSGQEPVQLHRRSRRDLQYTLDPWMIPSHGQLQSGSTSESRTY